MSDRDHGSPAPIQLPTFSIADTPAEQRRAQDFVAARYRDALALAAPASGTYAVPLDVRIATVRAPDGTVLATLTLQSPAFAPSGSSPLELESHYELASLGIPPERIAEVRRVAALPGAGACVRRLYTEAARYCLRHGITRWIGLVEAGDQMDAADAVYGALHRRGLTMEPPPLAPRFEAPLYRALQDGFIDPRWATQPFAAPVRPLAFARDIGARVISVASVHPHYPRLIIPMLSSLPHAERH